MITLTVHDNFGIRNSKKKKKSHELNVEFSSYFFKCKISYKPLSDQNHSRAPNNFSWGFCGCKRLILEPYYMFQA